MTGPTDHQFSLLKRRVDRIEADDAARKIVRTNSRVGAVELAVADIVANPPSAGGTTGAVGFTISADGDLLIGYAGATPTVSIDAGGNLLLEV